jgi:phospholipid transport system substrate-binding protein
MKNLAPWIAASLVAWIAGSATSAVAKPSEVTTTERAARDIIDTTARDVLEVLRTPALTNKQRLERLEKIVAAQFDLRTMSRLVIGKRWKSFSDMQRSAYIDEFIDYVSNYYGNRLDTYTDEDVAVLGAADQSRGDVKVRTRMVGGEIDGVLVDYRLRRNDAQQWRVIDVTIEGISMVKNFRDQFSEVVKREGAEGLISILKKKNAEHGQREGSRLAESGSAAAAATP